MQQHTKTQFGIDSWSRQKSETEPFAVILEYHMGEGTSGVKAMSNVETRFSGDVSRVILLMAADNAQYMFGYVCHLAHEEAMLCATYWEEGDQCALAKFLQGVAHQGRMEETRRGAPSGKLDKRQLDIIVKQICFENRTEGIQFLNRTLGD